MTEQDNESTGHSLSHQRRLGLLKGYVPGDEEGSFNVVSQNTENANDASTHRHEVKLTSDNSGKRGGTNLGHSHGPDGDAMRNRSSRSFLQSSTGLQIIGMSLPGIAYRSSAMSFLQSKTGLVIIGMSLLGIASYIVQCFRAFRLKSTSMPDQDNEIFRSKSNSSFTHLKWTEKLESSHTSSQKTFDFGSILSPIGSSISPFGSAASCSKIHIDGESYRITRSIISFKEILSLIPRVQMTTGLDTR